MMSTPAPLPMRILVKGPSTVLLTSMMGGPRSDMVFARVLEQRLHAMGRPATVRNGGVTGWPTRQLFKTWDDEIAGWSPDIVVLQAGHMEIVHSILPRWLERGANTVNRRPGLIRHLYYRRFLRLIARGVLLIQKRTDRPGHALNKRRLRRAVRDTKGYIKMTTQFASPLILLMEPNWASGAKGEWYRGMKGRADFLSGELKNMIDELDLPNVRFVEISDLMSQFDPGTAEQLWSDGIHFTPEFHRAIGEKLADIANEWAKGQSHLDLS